MRVYILCSSFIRMMLALNLPSASTSIVLIQNRKETVLKSSFAMPMLYDTLFVGKWQKKKKKRKAELFCRHGQWKSLVVNMTQGRCQCDCGVGSMIERNICAKNHFGDCFKKCLNPRLHRKVSAVTLVRRC